MTPLDVITGGLAAWRISHMLLRENGPWRIFRRVRQGLGVVYYEDSNDVASAKFEITTCIWCLSMWVAALVTGGFKAKPNLARVLVMPYALSAVAVILDKKFGLK